MTVCFIYFAASYYVKCLEVEKELDQQEGKYMEVVKDLFFYFPGAREIGWFPRSTGKFQVTYETSFSDKAKQYGGIKNVPWDNWTIEEKMYLCAYGSSGNKLSQKDIQEIKNKYENK